MILQGKLTCRELSSLRVERGLIENIMTTAQVSEFNRSYFCINLRRNLRLGLAQIFQRNKPSQIVIYVKMTTFSLEEAS